MLCLGAGGVGKTSWSAALARSCAEAGLETLAVSLDPARRLGEALADRGAGLSLTIFEPEPREAFQRLVESLFDPETRRELQGNRIFLALSQALSGMHELAGIARLAQEVAWRPVDVVVVDTAPSRHAVRAIGLAARVLALLDNRALTAIAQLFGARGGGLGGRLLSWVKRPVASTLAGAVGHGPVEEIARLLELLMAARAPLAALARQADALLASELTRFVIVTTPTDSALATALALGDDLARAGRRPDAIVLNRVAPDDPAWLDALAATADLPRSVADSVGMLLTEHAGARRLSDEARRTLARRWPGVPLWTVPEAAHEDAAAVVARLRDQLGEQARALLLGPWGRA